VPRTHDERVPTGKAGSVGAEHVGKRVHDPLAEVVDPRRIKAGGQQGVRRGIRTGGVDDRAGIGVVDAGIRYHAQHEGGVGAVA